MFHLTFLQNLGNEWEETEEKRGLMFIGIGQRKIDELVDREKERRYWYRRREITDEEKSDIYVTQ